MQTANLSDVFAEILTVKALLLEQTSKPLNLAEAAQYLGFSKSHLYKLTSSNAIKHFKPQGKQVYFQKSDLDAFLLRNPIQTNAELEQKATDYVTLGKRGN
ncbi:MAG: helix-turn-helix domain-containing protein [Bacteroidota bacterium]